MRSQQVKYSVIAIAALGLLSPRSGAQQKSATRDDKASSKREEAVKAAGAKPTPHTAEGHPDLSGIWLLPGIVSNAFGYGGPPGEVSQDGKEHTV